MPSRPNLQTLSSRYCDGSFHKRQLWMLLLSCAESRLGLTRLSMHRRLIVRRSLNLSMPSLGLLN